MYKYNYGSITKSDVKENASEKFDSLMENVGTNVYTLHLSCRTMETTLKSIGSFRDNPDAKSKIIHLTQVNTNKLIEATVKTFTKLASLTRNVDKKRQLQLEKLNGDFKEVIERYSCLEKQVVEALHMAIREYTPYAQDEEDDYDVRPNQLIGQKQFDQELLGRHVQILQIENDTLHINEITKELSSLIHEQGDTIDTIANYIDYSESHISEGAARLYNAVKKQKQNRSTVAVLLIAICVFIVCGIMVLFAFGISKNI